MSRLTKVGVFRIPSLGGSSGAGERGTVARRGAEAGDLFGRQKELVV